MNTFDKVSDQYKEKSLIQQKAALLLILPVVPGILQTGSVKSPEKK